MGNNAPVISGTWREGSGRLWRSYQNGNQFTWIQDGTNRMATGTIVATDSLGTSNTSWMIHITFDGSEHWRLVPNIDASILTGKSDTFHKVKPDEAQPPANVYNYVGKNQAGIQPHGNLLGSFYRENSGKMWEVISNKHTGHIVMKNQTDGRLADGYIMRDVFANKYLAYISFHNQNGDDVIRSETNDLKLLPLSNGDCLRCEGQKTVTSVSYNIGGLTLGLSSSGSTTYTGQPGAYPMTGSVSHSTSYNTTSSYSSSCSPSQPSVSTYSNQPGPYPISGSSVYPQPTSYQPQPSMYVPPPQPFTQPTNYQPNPQPSMYMPPPQPFTQPTVTSYPSVSIGFSQPTIHPTVTSSTLGQSIIQGCQNSRFDNEKYKIVVSYTSGQCNPISASEISQIISLFSFDNEKVKVLEQLKMTNNIAGMTCASAAPIISSLVHSSNKLKAVYALSIYMVDRRQNAETICKCLNFLTDQKKARQHLLEC